MQIRVAKASDLAEVVACQDLAFNLLALGTNIKDVRLALADQIRERVIHLISDAGKALGYISFWKNCDHLFVSTVAVLPSHRRKGLGGQLLKFAENEAVRLGLKSVSLFTDGNIAGNLMFYRRGGYRETGRCVDRNFSRVFFSKAVVPCMQSKSGAA